MEPEGPLPYPNIPPSLPPLKLIISVHWTPLLFFQDPFYFIHLFPPRSFKSTSFIQNLPTKMLFAPLLSPIRSTYPAHLILLYFITRIICGEEYTPWSSTLCDFLQFPVTSSLLEPHVSFSTLLSITVNSYSFLNLRHQDKQTYRASHKLYRCVF